jgi:hypothetical protein
MPNQPFEVASPFEADETVESMIEALADEALDAQSLEINARRQLTENAEALRRARAI